jgi:hypothetical protein
MMDPSKSKDPKRPGGGNAVGDPRRCTAKSKQSGERCKSFASPGRTVCVMHGGRSRAGIAHPGLTRGGRYSKHLPKGLLEAYDRARVDPELLHFRDEIALVYARINELLTTLSGDAAPGAWGEARGALKALKSARTAQARAAAIAQLEAALETEKAQRRTWNAILAALDQVRKLTVAERRRMIDAGELIPVEDAVLFVQTLLVAVRDTVKDPAVRQRIHDAMQVHLEHQRKADS